ncbi:MAG: RDD family protein [Candidatus Hodarchaeota archaeon]
MQSIEKKGIQGSTTLERESIEAKFCPSCDSRNQMDSMFCSICGEVLKDGSFQNYFLRDRIYTQTEDYPYEGLEQMSESSPLVLASWSSRFVAWLLDGIFIILLSIVFFFLGPFVILVPIGYFTIAEYYYGTTLGKKILKLKVVDERTGEKPTDFIKVGISNLGKVFLLPIDVLLGLIVKECSEKNQRIFQRATSLVVIKDR